MEEKGKAILLIAEVDVDACKEIVCPLCPHRVDEEDFFECSNCGCEFAVIDHEKYNKVQCPVCSNLVWEKEVPPPYDSYKYLCQDCGNEFDSDKTPRFCPACGSEDLIHVA